MAQLFPSGQQAIQGPNIVPQAARADGYYDANFAAGPDQPSFLNLGPLSKALQQMFKVKGEVRAQDEAAQGAKAWADSPEARANFQAAQAGDSAEDATRKALSKEIAKGNIPVAASPHFQLAFAQQAAEGTMRDFRAAVLLRVSEASQVSDGDDNPAERPDPQDIIDEEWAKFAGGVALNTGPGTQVAAGMYSRVQNEFVSRVTQETSVNQERFYMREYSRSAAGLMTEWEGSLGGGPLEAGDLQGLKDTISAYVLRDGVNANIKDVASATWTGMRDGIMVVSESNPTRALLMLDALEDVMMPDGGTRKRLGDFTDIQLSMNETAQRIQDAEIRKSREEAAAEQQRGFMIQNTLETEYHAPLREAWENGLDAQALSREMLDADANSPTPFFTNTAENPERLDAEQRLDDYLTTLAASTDRVPGLYERMVTRDLEGQLSVEDVRATLGDLNIVHYEDLLDRAQGASSVTARIRDAGFSSISFNSAMRLEQTFEKANSTPGLSTALQNLEAQYSYDFGTWLRGEAVGVEEGSEEWNATARTEKRRLDIEFGKASAKVEADFNETTKGLKDLQALNQPVEDYLDEFGHRLAPSVVDRARTTEAFQHDHLNRVLTDTGFALTRRTLITDITGGREDSAGAGASLTTANAVAAELTRQTAEFRESRMAEGGPSATINKDVQEFATELATELLKDADVTTAGIKRVVTEGGDAETSILEGQTSKELAAVGALIEAEPTNKLNISRAYFGVDPDPINHPISQDYTAAVTEQLTGAVDKKGNRRSTPKTLRVHRESDASQLVADLFVPEGAFGAFRKAAVPSQADIDALGPAITAVYRPNGLTESGLSSASVLVQVEDPEERARLEGRLSFLKDLKIARGRSRRGQKGLSNNQEKELLGIQTKLQGTEVPLDMAQLNPFTDPLFRSQRDAEEWAADAERVTISMNAWQPPVPEDRRADYIAAQIERSTAHNN